MKTDRRNFLFVSTGAAAGSFLAEGVVEGDQPPQNHAKIIPESGLVSGLPKPLRHPEISGFLSAAQIAPHHTAHYGGALKGYNAADNRLEENAKTGGEFDPAAYATLERIRTSKANSVVLHELYFDGLVPTTDNPQEDLLKAIAKRFGSYDKWAADFQNSAKEAAGWAMLVQHSVNRKLYNVVSDEHAMSVLWMATPLVVIDVYEHAFYIDYHNRKSEYVEKFMDHIDWDEVNRRYRALA